MDFLPLMMLLSGMKNDGNQDQFQVDDMIGQLNQIKTIQNLTSGKMNDGNMLNMASSLLGGKAGFPSGGFPQSAIPAQSDAAVPALPELPPLDSDETFSPMAQETSPASQNAGPASGLSGLLGGMGGKDMQQAMTLMNMMGGMNGLGGMGNAGNAGRNPQSSAANENRQIKIENRTINYMPNRKLH